ncbi:hypothetical protein F4803DRAFT_527516 [Xylaria telfairii]|nr:hypothetical protein F4803DRAFT_527516 [Xylaria telfairii]
MALDPRRLNRKLGCFILFYIGSLKGPANLLLRYCLVDMNALNSYYLVLYHNILCNQYLITSGNFFSGQYCYTSARATIADAVRRLFTK